MRREAEISETMSCMARVLTPPAALRVLPCIGSEQKITGGGEVSLRRTESG